MDDEAEELMDGAGDPGGLRTGPVEVGRRLDGRGFLKGRVIGDSFTEPVRPRAAGRRGRGASDELGLAYGGAVFLERAGARSARSWRWSKASRRRARARMREACSMGPGAFRVAFTLVAGEGDALVLGEGGSVEAVDVGA